jgi:DNA-binding response OmpR family regulator
MNSARVLIADDNADIRRFLMVALQQEGYEVIEAKDGLEALAKFKEFDPGIIILDIAMGQPDGLEVCRQIREKSRVPIIILTDKDADLDEVMSLAIGADDYITKPCTAQVINLRVAIQIRHAKNRMTQKQELLTVENMELNISAREFSVANSLVPLTRTEFDFLQVLMQNPDHVHTREGIYEAIGGSAQFSSDKLLDTHASRIRIKIREAGGPNAIIAVRGIGYRIVAKKS